MLAIRANLLTTDQVQRRQWRIRGRVQGVGFRPFIYRLAREYELTGRVLNDEAGVVVEAQGTAEHLMRLLAEPPPRIASSSAARVRRSLPLGRAWSARKGPCQAWFKYRRAARPIAQEARP